MFLTAALFFSMLLFPRYFRIMTAGIFDKRAERLFRTGFACTACGTAGLLLTPFLLWENQTMHCLMPLIFSTAAAGGLVLMETQWKKMKDKK
ncbi:TPA: hypothetical protein ACFP4Y_000263 [Neisseria bacilliformis]